VKNWWGNTALQALIFGAVIGVSIFLGLTAYNIGRGLGEVAGLILGLAVCGALIFFGLRYVKQTFSERLDAKHTAAAEHRKSKRLAPPET
jgi:uncharacterized membrane protein